mgnify:CR=1 FL=1
MRYGIDLSSTSRSYAGLDRLCQFLYHFLMSSNLGSCGILKNWADLMSALYDCIAPSQCCTSAKWSVPLSSTQQGRLFRFQQKLGFSVEFTFVRESDTMLLVFGTDSHRLVMSSPRLDSGSC